MKKIITLVLLLSMSQISYSKTTSDIDVFEHSSTSLLTWKTIIQSRWSSIDKDNNKLLDKKEIQNISLVFNLLSSKYFPVIDKNADKFISSEELDYYSKKQESNQKEKINTRWQQVDLNNNYEITVEEAQSNEEMKNNFFSIDYNRDNIVIPEELINFYNTTLSSKLGIKS